MVAGRDRPVLAALAAGLRAAGAFAGLGLGLGSFAFFGVVVTNADFLVVLAFLAAGGTSWMIDEPPMV